MPPAKCPFLHRCNKYTELTLRIDRLVESNAAKDRRIAALEAENAALKAAQCGSPTNPADVRIFGSSTPSSLIPIKANSTEEARRRKGGQPDGHKGHGRKAVADKEVDETVELERPATCPHCGTKIDRQTWEKCVVPAFGAFMDLNRDLFRDHVGEHRPLFQIDMISDLLFKNRHESSIYGDDE